MSGKGLKPEIRHVLFFISKLICYIGQKVSLKQAPVGILPFCDIFMAHQQRQCVTQDLISAIDEGIESGERGGSVVECRTPEREVGGSKPTAAVLCP